MTLFYYVSGHGHGHARRSAEILEALAPLEPGWKFFVRTTAPAWIYKDVPRLSHSAPEIPFDSGAVEDDVFTINPGRTIEAVKRVLHQADSAVAQELKVLRENAAQFILADIPWLAGLIATRAKLPCVGISNFTWDFVYEPMLGDDREGILTRLRDLYGQMDGLIQLPMHAPSQILPILGSVSGFVAQKSSLSQPRAQEAFGLAADPRPKVLFTTRGGLEEELLISAMEKAPDFHFVFCNTAPARLASNATLVHERPGLMFPELLSACDIVISKMGSGLVSDSLANHTKFLYPAKTGFREDDLTGAAMQKYGAALEMPLDEYRAGNWRPFLQRLAAEPWPEIKVSFDGAREAAEGIRKVVRLRMGNR